MRYLGGKSRLATGIADVLEKLAVGGSGRFFDLTVGGGSITAEAARRDLFEQQFAGDLCPDLILLWQGIQLGWVPPESLSYNEWLMLRDMKPSALRGFAGFGASFGGMWFRTYARPSKGVEDDSIVHASRNSLLRDRQWIRSVRYRCRSYADESWGIKYGDVVYADPPYEGTEGYKGAGDEPFDHAAFWTHMTALSFRGVRVAVSEFHEPHLEGWVRAASVLRATAFSGDNQHANNAEGNLRSKVNLDDTLWVHRNYLHLVLV